MLAERLRAAAAEAKQAKQAQAAPQGAAGGAGPGAAGAPSRATLVVCPVSVLSNWRAFPSPSFLNRHRRPRSSPDSAPDSHLIRARPPAMHHRADQIEAHLGPGAVRSHLYHGPDRNTDPEFLSAQDIVVRRATAAAAADARRGQTDRRAAFAQKSPRVH